MVLQDKTKLVTAEELAAMPEGDVQRELVKGEVIEMSPSAQEHGFLSSQLTYLIQTRSDARKLGLVTTEGPGYLLYTSPDTVRAPDVGFIARDRMWPKGPGGYFANAPDLAIEIASPNDKLIEIHEKVQEYLNAGTRLVCVLLPPLRQIVVHTSLVSQTLHIDDTLDLGDILPGLSLPVREIFAVLDEEPDDDGNHP